MSGSRNFSSGGSGSGSFHHSSPTEETQQPGPYPYGNFSGSTVTSIRNLNTGLNQLAPGGRPVFSIPRPETVSSKSNDIVPEISNIYDGFKPEEKRLETFYDWPSDSVVKKEDLARNGFIYLHSKDRVQCVFCRGVLSSWEPGDVVADEHKKHCPECPFAFGYNCGNIPLNNRIILSNVADSRPVQQHTTIVQSNSFSVPQQRSAFEMTSMLPALPSVGQPLGNNVTTTEPKYREWGDEYKRIRSFINWPTQMTQTPIELAKAGLLYMGNGDRCKCFWCGGELYDWEPADVPWEEHAKWFPQCGYVRAMKGDNFIKYVKDKQTGSDANPPVEERMRTPHVLAVLREGYTQEQVREAFNRFGQNNLFNAPRIVEAINQINQERQAAMKTLGSNAGSWYVTQGSQWTSQTTVRPPQEPEAMETEETTLKEREAGSESTVLTRATGQKPADSARVSGSGSGHSEVETVRRENAKLKDEKLCKICMDAELCMTFLPCGHLATCEECAKTLTECPICRKQVMQRVKIFWA